MTGYAHRHTVAFEETNLVGNVYYVNYLRWQGRCAALFLRDRAPASAARCQAGFTLSTVACDTQFLGELFLFDDVVTRMSVIEVRQGKVEVAFEHARLRDGEEQVVARGRQELAALQRGPRGVEPCRIPDDLVAALHGIAAPQQAAVPLDLGEDPEAIVNDSGVPSYEDHHVVAFEETDTIGAVHYTHQVRWQGRCRELFFWRYAPEVVQELEGGLALATVNVGWRSLRRLAAFDEVTLQLFVPRIVRNRIQLEFTYTRGDELVARGRQEIASMRRTPDGVVNTPLPDSFAAAASRVVAEATSR